MFKFTFFSFCKSEIGKSAEYGLAQKSFTANAKKTDQTALFEADLGLLCINKVINIIQLRAKNTCYVRPAKIQIQVSLSTYAIGSQGYKTFYILNSATFYTLKLSKKFSQLISN